MINKKESPRILAAKYLLVAPAKAAVLLGLQISGLQAAEIHMNDSAPAIVEHMELFGHKDANSNAGDSVVFHGNSFSEPLVLIDGKEGTRNDVSPQNIEKIEVFKNEAATDLYGEKAASGAFVITSKTETAKVETISDYRIRQGTKYVPEGNDIVPFSDNESASVIKIRPSSVASSLEPVHIVDGKDVVDNIDINIKDIQSIEVLKDQTGINVYGEKGKNGVIKITLR